MLSVEQQIQTGKLVCPKTRQGLRFDKEKRNLITVDQSQKYRLAHGVVPLLLVDEKMADEYVKSSQSMVDSYQPETLALERTLMARLKAFLTQDYRTRDSKKAFQDVFDGQPPSALCVSIGGGPRRPHPCLVNLNIGPFPGVEVVADAHLLPYADNSVDAINCEAVLEHLPEPKIAVAEMYRVLKPGGRVFAATPFLQHYHGFPHHYQNFTLTGHKHLFQSAGFSVVDAGACVGPVYMLVGMVSNFIHEYAPGPLKWPLQKTWGVLGIFIRPLDRLLNQKSNSYIMASTTYLVGEKAR